MQDRKRVEALKQAKKEDKAALLLQSQFKGIYDRLPQITYLDRLFLDTSFDRLDLKVQPTATIK